MFIKKFFFEWGVVGVIFYFDWDFGLDNVESNGDDEFE